MTMKGGCQFENGGKTNKDIFGSCKGKCKEDTSTAGQGDGDIKDDAGKSREWEDTDK